MERNGARKKMFFESFFSLVSLSAFLKSAFFGLKSKEKTQEIFHSSFLWRMSVCECVCLWWRKYSFSTLLKFIISYMIAVFTATVIIAVRLKRVFTFIAAHRIFIAVIEIIVSDWIRFDRIDSGLNVLLIVKRRPIGFEQIGCDRNKWFIASCRRWRWPFIVCKKCNCVWMAKVCVFVFSVSVRVSCRWIWAR